MRKLGFSQTHIASKVASLDSLIKQLKELHILNGTLEYYDHNKELKTRQLTIQALESISVELTNIKKQLHIIKHKNTRG